MKKCYVFPIFIVLFLFASCSKKKESIVPTGHPRVYISESDLPDLRQKTKLPGFKETWEVIKILEHPWAKALQALIIEDETMAAKAAVDFLPVLKQCTDGRIPYNDMQIGACIYDWCHAQMSDSLKLAYIAEFKRIAASHTPYFPAQKGHGVLVGHNTEGWLLSDQLPAGLAIYDECPVMFDSASVVFFDEFVPARNFVYQAHMHHQGDSYSSVRFLHDLFANMLFRAIGIDAFSGDMQYVPYQLIYNYRTDGQQLRDGDTFDDMGNDAGGNSRAVNHKALSLLICGSLYNDPYQLEMFKKYNTTGLEKVFEFIVTPINKATKPIGGLPMSKYFGGPMGEIIARTGWNMDFDSNDAIIQIRIGNYFFGNHQTKDFGTFQVYYKGPLAIASGAYQGVGETYGQAHWLNYHHQTISKNGLLIYDPNEKMDMNSINDGGQRWPNNGDDHPKDMDYLLEESHGYKMAEVTAHSIGPDPVHPVYSYISGDITKAYSSQKADFIERSMLTINTGDKDFPALFFVFDKVRSTNEGFKKTWLMHSIQEPEVSGNLTTIVRDGSEFSGKGNYNGKLFCQTVIPENAKITKIGGAEKGFWIEGSQTNYFIEKENPASEEGAWRVEVSPTIPSKNDLFFHAMAVTDAENMKPIAFIPVNSGDFKGVQTLGYVVFFNSEKETKKEIKFQVDRKLKGLFIGGMASGNYHVLNNGREIMEIQVPGDKKSIFLENMASGNYIIQIKNKNGEK